jgi:hypothetical protein
VANRSKTGSSPNSIANVIKELMITFLTGILRFTAFALLRDRAILDAAMSETSSNC